MDFYPITITESRYQGTYSGGPWILAAGVHNPRSTNAFGGDVPCMDFWRRVREDGPVIEIDDPIRGGTVEAVFIAGDSPEDVFEQFEQDVRTFEEEYEERYEWPDIDDTDFEDFEKTDKRRFPDEGGDDE